MAREAWFGIRWLDAVRAHPGRSRFAWASANALAPYSDNDTGEAVVTLARMHDDSRQPVKALQRGFKELEALGLLRREKRRKEGSQEWDTTLYRPLLATRRTKATYGKRPNNYTLSSVPKDEGHRSKRPTGEFHDEFCICDDCLRVATGGS